MIASNLHIFYLAIVFPFLVGPLLACNGGYNVRIDQIENCGGPQQILMVDTNTTVEMTEKCEIITIGCSTTSGFQKALVKYSISKNGAQLLTGSEDLCKSLDKADRETLATLQMFGLPTKCPVEAGRTCTTANQKLDISDRKNLLSLARGKIDVYVNMLHEKGNSCMKIKGEIIKKRKN